MIETPAVEFIEHPRVRFCRVRLSDADEVARAVQASLPELMPWGQWATPDYGLQ
ncbi:MAG: hypothetical protein AAFV53_10030 [Myxococcota bacterium]